MTDQRNNHLTGNGLSREAVKFIAILTMTGNHAAIALLPPGFLHSLLVNIGYFTAAAMCFFLAEGFRYTSSKRRYGERLLLCGVLSQLPFWMAFHFMTFNMMFTLFLCFLLLVVRTDQRFAGKRLIFGILIVFASGLCDWPVLAPLFTLLFWNAGEDWEARKKACWYVVILYAVFTFVSVCGLLLSPVEALIHTVLSSAGPAAACLTILFLYNGKETGCGRPAGKSQKWFFYLYYPAHLLVIGLIKMAMVL